MISPAQRMQLLTTTFFATLGPKIEALQAAGKDVIRLDEGSPDLPPAAPIIAALAHSAAAPTTHSYQPHHGPKLCALPGRKCTGAFTGSAWMQIVRLSRCWVLKRVSSTFQRLS